MIEDRRVKSGVKLLQEYPFATAVTGFNLAQENSNVDVSVADIAMMAEADGEIDPDCPNGCLAT